ncbi:MAG: DEAD/DEAH box helicase [Rickettsiaceae bacterium]|nr:DEAD/DEAH box helicase [Rickettsiaceae bacterium]
MSKEYNIQYISEDVRSKLESAVNYLTSGNVGSYARAFFELKQIFDNNTEQVIKDFVEEQIKRQKEIRDLPNNPKEFVKYVKSCFKQQDEETVKAIEDSITKILDSKTKDGFLEFLKSRLNPETESSPLKENIEPLKAEIEKLEKEAEDSITKSLDLKTESLKAEIEKSEKEANEYAKLYEYELGIFSEIIKSLKSINNIEECQEIIQSHLDKLDLDFRQLRQLIPEKDGSNQSSDEPEVTKLEDIIDKSAQVTKDSEQISFFELLNSMKDLDNDHMERLKDNYNSVLAKYNNLPTEGLKELIRNYKDDIERGQEFDSFFAVALIMKANEISVGKSLRDAQILAILEFLDGGGNKFCQIDTGQGKTTITSALAVLQALQGKYVDIITSNEVLAKQAVEDRKAFYNLFGISVTHNCRDPNNPYTEGLKDCYAYRVVYGTIGTHSYDDIYNNVECLKTKTFNFEGISVARPKNVLILDEADNVTLDNFAVSTNQSKSVAGYNEIKYILFKIWEELSDKEGLNKENLVQDIADTITIPEDLPQFLKNVITNEKIKFLIEKAYEAKFELSLGDDYEILKKNGEENIVPLDKAIGVRLSNFIWTDLHPFLQMKHSLNVDSCSSLSSVSVPNCAYITKYQLIQGLTGTLGSAKEREFVKEVYSAKTSIIPPFLENKRTPAATELVRDAEWLDRIQKEVDDYAERAILIICNTPNDVDIIQKKLNALYKDKIIIYKNEDDADKISQINENGGLRKGYIIISTNIGGRGTDIIINSEVKEGLHVCLTYLPDNERIQHQAEGRAGRNGAKGSARILIRQSEYNKLKSKRQDIIKTTDSDTEHALKLRDEIEADRLKLAIEQTNKMLEEFRAKNHVYDRIAKLTLNQVSKFLIDDIKLRLALSDSDTNSIDDVKAAVEKIIRSNAIDYKFINPFYAINHAKTLLRYKDVEAANIFLDSQNHLEAELKEITSYHLLLFEIAMQKNNSINNILMRLLETILGSPVIERDEGYKISAKGHLEEAARCLERDYNKINKFLKDKNFDKIGLDSDKQKFNAGENMTLAHLESERELLFRFKAHIDELRQNLDRNNTNFYIKELSSIFEDESFKSILKDEKTQSFERGLDTLYSLKEIINTNNFTAETKKAKCDILIGIAMLSSAYIPIPGLGTAIAAGLSIPASKKIKSAVNKLLSIILGDYDPKNYVEEEYGTEDYLLDIASSIGGPATGVTNILKSIAKDYVLDITFKHACRKLVADCKSDVTKQVSKSFPEDFKKAIEKFAEYKNNTLNTIKDLIMSPIKTTLDQISTEVVSWTTNIVDVDESVLIDKAERFNNFIASIEEASRSIFDSIESIKTGILDIFWDFRDKLGQFKELKDLKFNLKGSKLKKIKEIADLTKKLVLDKKITKLSEGIFKFFDLKYFEPIIETIKKFPQEIGDKIETLKANISDFSNFLIRDFKDAFGGKAIEFIKQIINTITTKCEVFIDKILCSNPLDKFLMKYGINLSDSESTLEQMTSMATDKIFKVIKSSVFKTDKPRNNTPDCESTTESVIIEEDASEKSIAQIEEEVAPNNLHNDCVIKADMALLSLTNEINRMLDIIRPSIKSKLEHGQGLSKLYAKQILEDFSPKGVAEYRSNTNISQQQIEKLLESYESDAAIALFTSKEGPLGHAYCFKKNSEGTFVWIDETNQDGLPIENLNGYQQIDFLIPKKCSGTVLSKIGKEIISGKFNPSHKFSLTWEIKKLWEKYFEASSFGANARPEMKSEDIFDRELTKDMKILHEIAKELRNSSYSPEEREKLALERAKERGVHLKEPGSIVRTEPIQLKNMDRNVGEHEMIPTKLLIEMYLRSCGAVEGYDATSIINKVERDWLEIQNALRMNTVHVIWQDNENNVQGHAGALYNQPSGSNNKGGQTKGQPAFHRGIEEIIKQKSCNTPKAAAKQVLMYHLKKTLNKENLLKGLEKTKEELYNYLGKLTDEEIIKIFSEYYAQERNACKVAVDNVASDAEHSEFDDIQTDVSKKPILRPSMDTSRAKQNSSIEDIDTRMNQLNLNSADKAETYQQKPKKVKLDKTLQKGLMLEEASGPDNIHPTFNEYTIKATQDILKLRIKDNLMNKKISILEGNYIFDDSENNISDMLHKLLSSPNDNTDVVLAPFSISGKHAVGLMFIKQENGEFKAFYIESENNIITYNL